tara:strand:+ start:16764 stop:17918 length:1155 start_codon:yes stop_codon:yes gene_type:complete
VTDFINALNSLKKKGYYRSRAVMSSAQDTIIKINGKKIINFSSNNYLNLSNNTQLKKLYAKKINEYGIGSGSSPLISGYSKEHHQLEKELAKYTGFESAIVTNSGYLSNVGLLNAITEKETIVYQDKMNHNSIVEGTRLSSSKLIRYRHNDYNDLINKISSHNCKTKIIYVDAVFSMTGEISNLKILSEIAKDYKALLVVDDAHGFGVIRYKKNSFPTTLGMFKKQDLNIDAYIGTFGKAVGTFGSFIASNNDLIDLVVQKSKPYIYSTSLPMALAGITRDSLRYIKSNYEINEKLVHNIEYFKQTAEKHNIVIEESDTPIQIKIFGSPKKVLGIQRKAFAEGLFIQAIRYPTVPKNRDLIRIGLTAGHKRKHIETLLNFLKRI